MSTKDKPAPVSMVKAPFDPNSPLAAQHAQAMQQFAPDSLQLLAEDFAISDAEKSRIQENFSHEIFCKIHEFALAVGNGMILARFEKREPFTLADRREVQMGVISAVNNPKARVRFILGKAMEREFSPENVGRECAIHYHGEKNTGKPQPCRIFSVAWGDPAPVAALPAKSSA